MSHELPRAWLLPMLLAAANPATVVAAPAPPPIEQPAAGTPQPELGMGDLAATPERQFGPWRVLAELGSGGMGTVYLAESTGPVVRRAAVKVIRRELVDASTLARFATEQQALANAEHEHVVRLYDAGTTTAGEPWLAMEFVDGETITRYCERRALDRAARLRLVVDVARAVQHLHERGIRHGDLKPENILVVERNGLPVPKLIDLGLATVSGRAPIDEHTTAGTPVYMAPELFTLPTRAIDDRSEVYTLGVLLHEVLTGKRPGNEAVFGPDGVLQARLRTAPGVDRRLPHRLRKLLTRAMAQQRDARTASVGALVVDLQRAIGHDAVIPRVLATGCVALVAAAAGWLAGWLASA